MKTINSPGLDAITRFGRAQDEAADRRTRALDQAAAKRAKAHTAAEEAFRATISRADDEYEQAENAATHTHLRDLAAARQALATTVPGATFTLNGATWELRRAPGLVGTPAYATAARQGDSWRVATPEGTAWTGELSSALGIMYRSFIEAYPELTA